MEKHMEHTKVFKALGDPNRARIVDMLSRGELCACVILEKFEMTQSPLSPTKKPCGSSGLLKKERKVNGRQRA
jgi:ArsR family transcriptional regulator